MTEQMNEVREAVEELEGLVRNGRTLSLAERIFLRNAIEEASNIVAIIISESKCTEDDEDWLGQYEWLDAHIGQLHK